jgi:RNA polymerase sigma factor (TIGR02999 family)
VLIGNVGGRPAEFDWSSLVAQCPTGTREAFGEAFTRLYREIHAIAVRQLRDEQHATIRPTALVHEAYLRLERLRDLHWKDRAHLLAMASVVTRQVLVDDARRRRAGKRDGGIAVTLSDEHVGAGTNGHDAIDVDDLLKELERFDDLASKVVSLRVFGGLSIEEAAQALEVSVATVNRRWATGRAWLAHELVRP